MLVTIVQNPADILALVIDVSMYVTVLRISATTKLDAVSLKLRQKKQIITFIVMLEMFRCLDFKSIFNHHFLRFTKMTYCCSF